MIIGLIIIVLCFAFTKSSVKPKKRKQSVKPPQPKDFENYYEYKSKLAEYNEQIYDEFLEKCKKGECTFIEKEIISHEREKGNKTINELKNKL